MGRPCLSGRGAWPASTKSPTLKVLWLAQLQGAVANPAAEKLQAATNDIDNTPLIEYQSSAAKLKLPFETPCLPLVDCP